MLSPKKLDAVATACIYRTSQFGGGLLPIVATMGVVMVMSQGAMFYKAKSSAKFLSGERNKIMAQQAAEAGVENTIAEIGSRRVVVNNEMEDYVVASGVQVGNGAFTTTLTTLSMGPHGDTINLNSTGEVTDKVRTVNAKLRLRNMFDTNQVIMAEAEPETTLNITTHTFYDTTYTTTVQDPNAMPTLNATAAYTACMSSGAKKCDVCHLPGGDITKANVINISKSAIGTHIGHHGDYVTTDGTCDIYQPQTTMHLSIRYGADTTFNITTNITYDTSMAIDTLVKVQVLSWR
jgi:hypothetical protein